MAQIDDQYLQITLGVVGVGSACVDFLVHQGAKMGLDRELIEAVPVVRFGLRSTVLDRTVVIVMSAAPLDIVQADAVIAVHTGEDGLEEELDQFDLLPIDPATVGMERLMGAGREHEPIKLQLVDAGVDALALDGFDVGEIDLESGEGISAAINPVVSRAATLLAKGEREARPCPTVVLHATHRARSAEDLQPGTFPRPGARLALGVSLHEPFGDGAWSCAFAGTVEAASGLHVVEGVVEPDGDVPDALEGRWRVELIREHEIWILRSMVRA